MRSFLLFYFLVFLFGCNTWKQSLVKEGGQNIAIQNAVLDFQKTEKGLNKQDSVFSVHAENFSEDILTVSILRKADKLYPTPEDTIGSNKPNFPTNYLIKKENLFFWYDSTSHVSKELVDALSKYNRIDSVNVNGIVGIFGQVDDGQRGVDYYFCKNDLSRYKKVVGTIALGWYKAPKLNCPQ